jgi:hypothetical protein
VIFATVSDRGTARAGSQFRGRGVATIRAGLPDTTAFSEQRMFRPTRIAAGCVPLLAAACAYAQPPVLREPGRDWVLGVGAQVDEESNDSLLGTFNWGVGDGTWLSFSAGRSRSPAERANVDADTLVAGLDHSFGTVGVALELERWGDEDALETSQWRGSVYYEPERFRIGLAYEQRDIDIPFTIVGPLGARFSRTAELSSDSLGVDVRVQPADGWQIYFSATEHDYDRDLAPLPRIALLNLLSTSTLTLANSFIDHERRIGFDKELGSKLMTFTFTTDRSAIDGSQFDTFDAALLFPIGRRVDLEVNLGSGRSDLAHAGLYGGLLFLIYAR